MSQTPLTFECRLSDQCSGCGWAGTSYQTQAQTKIENFLKTWIAVGLPILDFTPKFVSVDQAGLRDRVDLIIDNRSGEQRIGMFDQEHKEIIDLPECPQLSTGLQSWVSEFRKIKWPIQRGSARLRVSPENQRGVWLDFANEDVKNLFEEKLTLELLLSKAFVEIGQRRKHLVKDDERFRLTDPQFQKWFETYTSDKLTPHALVCNVGSFTQPGFRSNKVLIAEIFKIASQIQSLKPPRKVAEFGSGIGNFTLPLASYFKNVETFEVDRLACEALLQNLKTADLDNQVIIHQGDFQTINEKRNFSAEEFDLVFVDPPRSGLKQFLDPFFATSQPPRFFVYVSCFPDSFCKDAKQLYQLGYRLESVTIVDQFPQTPHSELVSFFTRS